MNFADFCAHPDLINERISPVWDVTYRALEGLPLADAEMDTWRALTGRGGAYEQRQYRELVGVKGRRAEGTKTACKYLVWKIHTGGYGRYAPKGERLHVPIIAQNRDVAREIKSYLDGFYTNSPVLAQEVGEMFRNSIELRSGFVIGVHTCSFRSPRGITAPIALLDELGVWRVEGTDVDREVVRSLTPAMVQFPNRRLIKLGSPWLKSGVLYEDFQRRNERPDVLTIHAPTALMNPRIPAEELERERAADPVNFRREFGAEWLDDVDQFLPDSDINAAVVSGRREIPPSDGLRGRCVAVLDASGLTGRDSFVLAVGFRDVLGPSTQRGNGLVVAALRSWKRAHVGAVCDEIGVILKSYGLKSVTGDQYAATFLKELLAQREIELVKLDFTARSKPEIMLGFKTALSQGAVALLDHAESLRELRQLESQRTSGGHYRISAPRSAHDDFAVALALLAYKAKKGAKSPVYLSIGGRGFTNPEAARKQIAADRGWRETNVRID